MPLFSLLASGSNAQGQLANGTTEDSHTFSPCTFNDGTSESSTTSQRIFNVASGANHTLVLSESIDAETGAFSTRLWGCGDGRAGQLGLGTSEGVPPVFRPVELRLRENGLAGYHPRLVCASWQTTYIVLSTKGRPDVLISMGSNDFGDLGVGQIKRGQTISTKAFHIVKFSHLLDGETVWDENSLEVASMAAGQHHIIVQLLIRISNGINRHLTVGWGTARHGELGDSVGQKKTPFFSVPRIVLSSVTGDDVLSIAVGNQHSVFRHASGRLSSLGSNKKHQRNGLVDLRNVSFVGCTWNGTYAYIPDGIAATGGHHRGQLGRLNVLGTTIEPALVEFPSSTSDDLLSIACGSEHVLALRSGSGSTPEVWGWGWNEHGNMGLGSIDDVHIPTKIWPPSASPGDMEGKVTSIWAGCGTSWIALERQ